MLDSSFLNLTLWPSDFELTDPKMNSNPNNWKVESQVEKGKWFPNNNHIGFGDSETIICLKLSINTSLI